MWCAKQEFEDGNTVSEAKLVAFLREVSRTGNIKNKRSKLPDGKAKRLGKESLAGYAKAVGALQTVQAASLATKIHQLVVLLSKTFSVTTTEKMLSDEELNMKIVVLTPSMMVILLMN